MTFRDKAKAAKVDVAIPFSDGEQAVRLEHLRPVTGSAASPKPPKGALGAGKIIICNRYLFSLGTTASAARILALNNY
jgi:hypothetical protein